MNSEEALTRLNDLYLLCQENVAGEAILFAIKQISENSADKDMGEVSDGYHTFNQLYYQRTMLFSVIVNQNKAKCWKTHNHEDGTPCFGGGWFLVTIDTPEGSYGYHCEDKYWDLFQCRELKKAKHWDGYTEEDVARLNSLLIKEEKKK